MSDTLGSIFDRGSSVGMDIVVDAFYDDDRTLPNVPIDSWSLTWDVAQAIKGQVSLDVVYTGDAGDSLSPVGFLDTLAPYGQQLAVLGRISFGPIFTETVMLGRYRIAEAPTAVDEHFGFGGRPFVIGSKVAVEADDLLSGVKRSGFHGPSPCRYQASTWAELQRISGLPVARNLPDLVTPINFVYQPTDGGRLLAIQQLMSYLGGIAVTDSLGRLTSIPYDSTTVVLTLEAGPNGVVLDTTRSADSTDTINEIVGTYQAVDGTPIYATAYVPDGPLATDGPYGPNTQYDSASTVATQAAANARVKSVLQQSLLAQSNRVIVSMLLDLRVEIGDVVKVNGPRAKYPNGVLSNPAWTITGRVATIQITSSSRGTMTAGIDVLANPGVPVDVRS